MPEHCTTAPSFQLRLTPDKPALASDSNTTLRVLVRVQAPEPPVDSIPRQALHLALVLDRSGSMSGTPLEEAKRCARNIIDSLAPGDRAAIFAFDDEVEQVAPLTAASDKLALTTALAGITSGGSTNLHGGWRSGADELAAKLVAQLAHTDVHRVILLSDGCANEGVTELEEITSQCKSMAQRGVSTSTYGLGGAFNETLMLAMAAAGRGNAYYGQTAADLAEPFAAEFALLTSLCARGLVLKVKAPEGVTVKLRNEYEPVDGEALAWKLPDLAFAAEAWALLEFEVPAAGRTSAEPLPLAITVSVQANTPDSAALFMLGGLAPLPVLAAAQRDALPADELVARRMLELEAAQMLNEVRAAIDADDWKNAQRLVDDAATRFAGHEWAAAVVATMRRLIGERDKRLAMKEASYSGRSMSMRLALPDEPQFCVEDELAVPAFLRRKGEQGKGKRN